MKLLIIAALILVADCLSVQEKWFTFKKTHEKTYGNIVEEKLRFQIFQDNLKKIEEHNAKYQNGESSYYMGVNKYADLTTEEFSNMLLRSIPDKETMKKPVTNLEITSDVPESYDARTVGAVFPVRDQGECGSGYAFSITGALEGWNFLHNNVSVVLSPQELIDCSGSKYSNAGCMGGSLYGSYNYVAENGIRPESSYLYDGALGQCRKNESEPSAVSIMGYQRTASIEDALKWVITSVGPASVYVYANPLHLYQGGIYDDAQRCVNEEELLNHNVLVVGYDSEDGQDYWIVKNSWGVNWGEEGYIRIQRNPSICGILLGIHYTPSPRR